MHEAEITSGAVCECDFGPFDLTIADQGAFTGREGNTGALCTWFEGTMGCEVSFWGRMVRRDGYRAPEGFGENTGRLSLHGNFLVSMRRRARRGGARRVYVCIPADEGGLPPRTGFIINSCSEASHDGSRM